MNYLTRRDVLEKLYSEEVRLKGFGEPYGNKNMAQNLKETDFFTFVDQANTAVSSPFVDSTYDNGLNDKLNKQLKEAVDGFLSGGGNSGSSAEKFFQGYTQTLGQFILNL